MFHIRPRGYVPVGAPPSGPAELIQTNAETYNRATGGTTSFAAPTAAGSTLVIGIVHSESGAADNGITSVADDQGQNWSEVIAGRGPAPGSSWAAHIWMFANSVAGVQAVTLTNSGNIWTSVALFELTSSVAAENGGRYDGGAGIQCADDPGLTSIGGAFGIGVCTANGANWSNPTGWSTAWGPDIYERMVYRQEDVQFVNEVCDVSGDSNVHAGALAFFVAA